jgi:N2-(2-carboxyethyl)arginine synthase
MMFKELKTMQATELFLRSVLKCGVANVFGIVGGESQAINFNKVDGLNFYLTRHEFTAGIMADVCARLTKVPQMCYSTFGPGLTNLSTGVFSAIQDRSPVLAVSAQIPSTEVVFNQVHQCLNNVGFMQTITKYADELKELLSIPKTVQKALQIAVDGIPGPVYLSFPLDLMLQNIDFRLANKLLDEITIVQAKPPAKLNQKSLRDIITTISNAASPLIIVGNQVIRDGVTKEVVAFAEALNIAAVCTLASKGVFSEDHPLFICTLNKYLDEIFKENITNKLFSTIDLIILIGYDIGEDLKPSLWGKKTTILLNSHYNNTSSIFNPDLKCIGDLRESICAISSNVKKQFITKELQKIKQKLSNTVHYENTTPDSNIPFIIYTIRHALGNNGILCSDIGLHKQYAGLLSKTYVENTFICSNVCGTFGFGLPSAMAARLINKDPSCRIALICGDGGFHSGGQDLETAVRYNLPFVIILLKDNAFGLIKYYQLLGHSNTTFNEIGFGSVNFAKLAEANGAKGYELKSILNLPEILEEAFKSNEVCLIEIPITYNIELKEKFQ